MLKRLNIKTVVIGLALLTGAYFGIKKIQFSLTHETTDNAQVETQIIPVLPRVSGYLKMVAIKDFDSVAKGQLLAVIDDAELQAQRNEALASLQQAKSDVLNAEAALQNALSTLAVSKGNVTLNELKKKKADADVARDQKLLEGSALTKKQFDDSRFNAETADQQLLNARSEYAAAQSRIAILRSSVQKSKDGIAVIEARIAQFDLKLTYTSIFAPSSGRIGKKNVSEGQLVQAGTPLCSIVNDSTYWIVANFKESQIASLRPGKKVDIRVDAYPDLRIKGTVASLSEATGAKFAMLPPDNASGNFVKVTQRVPIKIWIDDLDQYRSLLRAGMSTFIVAEK
jgi:membrane fusion protein (multidrug efflux system)